jgi:methionyl-tRNA synthetase
VLSFANTRFEGKVPEPGELDDEDRALLDQVEARFETWMRFVKRHSPGAIAGSLLKP